MNQTCRRSWAWHAIVGMTGLAVFALLFAMTGEAGPAMLVGYGTGLVLLLFARLQEPGAQDGND